MNVPVRGVEGGGGFGEVVAGADPPPQPASAINAEIRVNNRTFDTEILLSKIIVALLIKPDWSVNAG
jgi:hypothetical protein